jgi:hypothetical protein
MSNRAAGRWALTIAAVALAVLTAKPVYACTNCPSSVSNLDGVAANALPTYQEPTAEEASEPVKLKKFTKPQTRSARRTTPRKPAASLAQRARAGQIAARNVKQDDEAPPAKARTQTDLAIATVLANANAALLELDNKTSIPASTVAAATAPAPAEPQVAPAPSPNMELVSADDFNELDRAAWEANQMPKLMKLHASDSRAELREDDSKWAQTSTIGKLFVAFGALLTLGSAIRMFMA